MIALEGGQPTVGGAMCWWWSWILSESRPSMRHKRYLQEHKRTVYISLLTSGNLNSYLADINEQVENMLCRLVKKMATKEKVTEQLKAENQMLWVQLMNNIHNRAMEVVNSEIIYQ